MKHVRALSFVWLALLGLLAGAAAAQDPNIGEYEGTYHADKAQTTKATGKVIAEGPGYYRIVMQAEPLQAGEPTYQFEVYGVQQGNTVNLFGRTNAQSWGGTMADGKIAATPNYYGAAIELNKVTRKSPTEGAPAPAGAVILLPYKEGQPTDMAAWNGGPWKAIDDGSLQCDPGKGSITTKQTFTDFKLHLEFNVPLMAGNFGQQRANSGIFMNNIYEVQVLDSFGLVPAMGDCGSIYNQTRPRVNACLPPEQWQTYDITFRSPRLNADGSVKELARISVELNGVKVQDNVEIEGSTLGHAPGEPPAQAANGPLQLQDHGNTVRYRNVWLVENK